MQYSSGSYITFSYSPRQSVFGQIQFLISKQNNTNHQNILQ